NISLGRVGLYYECLSYLGNSLGFFESAAGHSLGLLSRIGFATLLFLLTRGSHMTGRRRDIFRFQHRSCDHRTRSTQFLGRSAFCQHLLGALLGISGGSLASLILPPLLRGAILLRSFLFPIL